MRPHSCLAISLALAAGLHADALDDANLDPTPEIESGSAVREVETPKNDFERSVRFEVSYENHAWGYQHSGMIILADGETFTFDAAKEERADPKVGKYRHVTRAGKIGAKTMSKVLALAEQAAGGTVTVDWGAANDAGSESATAFLVDPASGKRRAVDLGSIGVSDAEATNNSPAAARLLKWLNKIREEAGMPTGF